jgi:hypothetical protein
MNRDDIIKEFIKFVLNKTYFSEFIRGEMKGLNNFFLIDLNDFDFPNEVNNYLKYKNIRYVVYEIYENEDQEFIDTTSYKFFNNGFEEVVDNTERNIIGSINKKSMHDKAIKSIRSDDEQLVKNLKSIMLRLNENKNKVESEVLKAFISLLMKDKIFSEIDKEKESCSYYLLDMNDFNLNVKSVNYNLEKIIKKIKSGDIKYIIHYKYSDKENIGVNYSFNYVYKHGEFVLGNNEEIFFIESVLNDLDIYTKSKYQAHSDNLDDPSKLIFKLNENILDFKSFHALK